MPITTTQFQHMHGLVSFCPNLKTVAEEDVDLFQLLHIKPTNSMLLWHHDSYSYGHNKFLRKRKICSFWEWVAEDSITNELQSVKQELLGISKELNDVKKKTRGHNDVLLIVFVLYGAKFLFIPNQL
ncbi:hypothetical protein LXL04_016611 [Taraxacum kok-saghyz]